MIKALGALGSAVEMKGFLLSRQPSSSSEILSPGSGSNERADAPIPAAPRSRNHLRIPYADDGSVLGTGAPWGSLVSRTEVTLLLATLSITCGISRGTNADSTA